MEPVPSAEKYVTGAKRGKICSKRLAGKSRLVSNGCVRDHGAARNNNIINITDCFFDILYFKFKSILNSSQFYI